MRSERLKRARKFSNAACAVSSTISRSVKCRRRSANCASLTSLGEMVTISAQAIAVAFDRLELVVRDALSPAHGSIDVDSEDAADEGGDPQVDELTEVPVDRPAAGLEDGVHHGDPRHQARGVRRDRV